MRKEVYRKVILFCAACGLLASGCLEMTQQADDPMMDEFDVVSIAEAVETRLADGDRQSTTGPTPPPEVIRRDMEKAAQYREAVGAAPGDVLIDNVPFYLWRHGCGPTAVGMLAGYYDALGFDIIPGDAGTQTTAADQAMASGGTSANPFPAGSEAHFEDHSLPIESGGTLLDDAFITAGRTPHGENCIADFMDTSKSQQGNQYGWSWDSDIGPSLIDYVALVDPSIEVAYQRYAMSSFTWEIFTNEIDNNRPMVFLVDTDGNGGTDHFVTVVGYRESPTRQYACHDTWGSTVRWEDFAQISSGQSWGIYSGHTFELTQTTVCTTNGECADTDECTIDTCVDGVCEHTPDPACAGDCTCPAGCDTVVDATVPFTKDGSDSTCYFFDGALGDYANSWNTTAVNLNGVDITNTYVESNAYPAAIDGGYYLYIDSAVPWAHVEIRGNATLPTCDDGIQNQGEEGIDCGGPCPDACQQNGCTCLNGTCDAVVNVGVGFTNDGAGEGCYFLSGTAGNYINSWNTNTVSINGTDITNAYLPADTYPAAIDGGYYLYVNSGYPWSHVEVR